MLYRDLRLLVENGPEQKYRNIYTPFYKAERLVYRGNAEIVNALIPQGSGNFHEAMAVRVCLYDRHDGDASSDKAPYLRQIELYGLQVDLGPRRPVIHLPGPKPY